MIKFGVAKEQHLQGLLDLTRQDETSVELLLSIGFVRLKKHSDHISLTYNMLYENKEREFTEIESGIELNLNIPQLALREAILAEYVETLECIVAQSNFETLIAKDEDFLKKSHIEQQHLIKVVDEFWKKNNGTPLS